MKPPPKTRTINDLLDTVLQNTFLYLSRFSSPRCGTEYIINPKDHFCRLAGTENNLPLQLVALCDAQLPHGPDSSLVHILDIADEYRDARFQ